MPGNQCVNNSCARKRGLDPRLRENERSGYRPLKPGIRACGPRVPQGRPFLGARGRPRVATMSEPDAEIRPGNALPLDNIPVGSYIHNIELQAGRGGVLVRSAGVQAQQVFQRAKEPKDMWLVPGGDHALSEHGDEIYDRLVLFLEQVNQ